MENAIQIDDDDEDELTQQPATQQSATQQSTDNNAEHKETTQEVSTSPDSVNDEVSRELTRLNTSYNPTMICLTTTLQSDPGNPNRYEDIEDADDPDGWYESVDKEINSIISRSVFGEETDDLPEGIRALGTRWVFKQKDNGTKKGRLVMLGYTQIPGVDYSESFSPVAANQTILFVFSFVLYMIYDGHQWTIHVIDVETAFLNADLDEDVYIKKPEGYKSNKSFIKLNKALYGLSQSPRAWFKKCRQVLLSLYIDGLVCVQSKVDPCLFIFHSDNQVKCFVVVYVDDCLVAGSEDVVNKVKQSFAEEFTVKDLGEIDKYLGVHYKFKQGSSSPYLLIDQTKYIQAIVEDFEKDRGKVKPQVNPGLKPILKNSDDVVTDQESYRSYVGRIMFATSKGIPHIASAVRELCEKLHAPNSRDWKKLTHLIGYLKNYAPLKVLPPVRLQPEVYVDSDYASDTDRRSITGMISTLGGSLNGWKSGKQGGVSKSSTEAEYIALSTAAAEARFLTHLLKEIADCEGRDHDYKAIIYEDNQGAIFLANNHQMGQRTKHIDISYKFTNEMIENGELDLIYIKSIDNVADILSKTTTNSVFVPLSDKVINGDLSRLKEQSCHVKWKGVEPYGQSRRSMAYSVNGRMTQLNKIDPVTRAVISV